MSDIEVSIKFTLRLQDDVVPARDLTTELRRDIASGLAVVLRDYEMDMLKEGKEIEVKWKDQ